MDYQLKILRFFSCNFRIRGIGRLINVAIDIYNKKRSSKDLVNAQVHGFKMLLDPKEAVDRHLLFFQHKFDKSSIKFIQEKLMKGDVFLDIGANIGIYSLIASSKCGNEGKVLSVEADPYNYNKLTNNIKLNDVKNITALNVGVADVKQKLRLGINTFGNRGGNSFLLDRPHTDSVEVNCFPLATILKENNIKKVKGAKFDIEGFEYRVLKTFFEEKNADLYPEFIVLEYDADPLNGKATVSLLEQEGYSTLFKDDLNLILVRKSA